MNYQELDLKELKKLLDIKRLGINVSEDYFKLCKEFAHKRVAFKNLDQLNGLFEKFLSFCSQEQELRFDITPYGRGGSQRTKKELQGKYMHAMRSRTLEQMDVLRNSFHSASLKFDTELLKWKLQLNVNFSEIREGKENKTFYSNYFHLGFRMLLTEEEVDADVFLSSLSNSLSKASLDYSKKDLAELQEIIALKSSYSLDNVIADNATAILKMEEQSIVELKEETVEQIKANGAVENITVEEQVQVAQDNKTVLSSSDMAVLFHIYKLNYEEYNEKEEAMLSYAKFSNEFFKDGSTKDSVKESVAQLFEIELFDLIE